MINSNILKNQLLSCILLKNIKHYIKWRYQHPLLLLNAQLAKFSLSPKKLINNITSQISTDTISKEVSSIYLLPLNNNFQQSVHKLKIKFRLLTNVTNASKPLIYLRKTFSTNQTLNQHAVSKNHDINKIQ